MLVGCWSQARFVAWSVWWRKEERKREILEFALLIEYQSKLNSEGWCLSENSYDQSIRKIKEVEPEILLKLKEREEKRDSAKAILELQQKAGLRSKSGSITDKGDKDKYRDKNRSTSNGNGPKDANGYYLCGNCNKTHKGVCHKPIPGASTDQNTTPRKDWMTKRIYSKLYQDYGCVRNQKEDPKRKKETTLQ